MQCRTYHAKTIDRMNCHIRRIMKTLLKSTIILLLALVSVISFVSACAKTTPVSSTPASPTTPVSSTPAPPKTLRIGVIDTLTGPGSETLVNTVQGFKTSATWINDKGGIVINGDKYLIELVSEDAGTTPDAVVAGTNKLVFSDNVKFVLGPTLTFLSDAITSITEGAKVLRISGVGPGTPEQINSSTPLTFLPSAKAYNCAPMLDYLLEAYPQVKTIALICTDEPGGLFVRDTAKKESEKRGLTVVDEDSYPIGTTDYYPLWTKVMGTKPDAVCIGPALTAWGAGLLKQARELGFKGPICSTGAGDPGLLMEAAGKELATDFFSMDPFLGGETNTPAMKELQQETQKLWNRQAIGDDLYGWIEPWYMAQAIQAAQSLDPTQVAKTWENMTSIEGLGGMGKMGGLESYGINHVVVTPEAITKIMNGEVEQVKWVMPAIP